jgi:putative transposase
VLRHQIAVLQRHLGPRQIRFQPADRALLAALLHPLPRPTLRGLRLLVRPDTILKRHHDLIARRHARVSRPRRPGRPRTLRSIRALVLRLGRENGVGDTGAFTANCSCSEWRRPRSTLWEILREAGMDPAPDRSAATWAEFLRSQAGAAARS